MSAESGTQDPHDELSHRLVDWTPDLTGTLMFVTSGEKVLLIHKKRGHGAGRINGPGGKIEPGESAEACAIRETREETGITPLQVSLRGYFKFVDLVQPQWLGYVFVARSFTGEPVETAEARPEWFFLDNVPYARMWEDDRHWLPRLLNGESLEGEFLFDDGRLLAHRVRKRGQQGDQEDTDR